VSRISLLWPPYRDWDRPSMCRYSTSWVL